MKQITGLTGNSKYRKKEKGHHEIYLVPVEHNITYGTMLLGVATVACHAMCTFKVGVDHSNFGLYYFTHPAH